MNDKRMTKRITLFDKNAFKEEYLQLCKLAVDENPMVIKAVLKIQTLWRGRKARKAVYDIQ